ncbi:MAG: D-alanyl-D-alanine carboxypeptidase/D-alanyl-D-alanine-endopeptidase [Planctomycetota bacterium]|nr:D-alanyl-D-alanine carboxypeptidase/D-alanyl-D-alanine-endopeptidase [Planctomycetota bacterium]
MIRIRLGRVAFPIIGALFLLGIGAPAELSFRDRLQQALFAKKPAKETGVFAVNLSTGEAIFAHDESKSLIPASNAKLWTTAAAIELLGADYQFTTTLDGRGKIQDGAWVGDLRLKGGGDPSISERFFEGKPTAVLEGWAKHLEAKGIRSVTGDLLVDDTFFDRQTSLPSWPKDDPSKGYLAQIGGLSFNENCVRLSIAPAGDGVRVTALPETTYIEVDNQCSLTEDLNRHLIRITRRPGENLFTVSGRVWKESGGYHSTFAIHDPALYFGTVFRDALLLEGIQIKGEIRRIENEKGWVRLDSHRSSLQGSIELANRKSLNFHAEQIFKTLGRVKAGTGSFAGGSEVVGKFLTEIGVKRGSFDVRDGSGLSRENRISARALVTLLRHMALGPDGKPFLSSLAISGDPDGTLKRRLRSKTTKGKVRAKTGTLRQVSCLTGVVLTKRGEMVVFSILMNGVKSTGDAKQAQNRFCEVLMDYVSD